MLALYLIIWWVVLFMVLPWKVRPIGETSERRDQGLAQSAPEKPYLFRKFMVTTVLSGIIFALLWTGIVHGHLLEKLLALFPPLQGA